MLLQYPDTFTTTTTNGEDHNELDKSTFQLDYQKVYNTI